MENFGKFLALPDVDFTEMAKNGNPPICDNLADYPKHVWFANQTFDVKQNQMS